MTPQEYLTDFLTAELVPLHRSTLLDEIARLCRVVPDSPKAKRAEWEAALDELIANGDVIAAGQRVQIVRKEKRSSGPTQESLF